MARTKIRDTTITLESNLTAAAIRKSKETLADVQIELEDLIREQQAAARAFTARREEILARYQVSNAEARTGKKLETVAVVEEADLDTNTVHIIRADDGTEVSTRPLRADERQLIAPTARA